MKIQFVTQEPFQWVKGYQEIFKDHELYVTDRIDIKHTTDIFMLMWCNEEAVAFINNYIGKAKIILFIRRYELYRPWIKAVNWSNVSEVIMVNDFLADKFHKMTGRKPIVIYNGITLEDWTFKERSHGKKIAMVGYIIPKKGHPLAFQIMANLSHDYELHLVGGVQDSCLFDYLNHYAAYNELNIQYHGRIPHDQMDSWLEDKNYILSTSYTEGCPNNVLEAMAKGIKPVIHNWPGAVNQFSDFIFNTVDDAKFNLIHPDSQYNSKGYRKIVEIEYSRKCFQEVKKIIDSYGN